MKSLHGLVLLQYILYAGFAYGRSSDNAFRAKFIRSELNYTDFLKGAANNSETMVPLQDTSTDTFFHVGTIPIGKLHNYTSLKFEDLLAGAKNKAWIPAQQLKEEIVNCIDLSYGSFSSNEFKYDKELHGWMIMTKFSCTPLKRDNILLGIAIARVRFRLKEVYLRRQNTYWTTSGRSIMIRDIQKIADLFALRYSKFVSNRAEEDLKALNSRPRESRKRSGTLLHLSSEAYEILEKKFPINLEYSPASGSRPFIFTSLTIPVKSRVMVVQASKRHSVLLNLSRELSGAAAETLDSCAEPSCFTQTKPNGDWKLKNDQHHCTVENAIIKRLGNEQDLIVYQTSRSFFKFDTHKRRTAHGVVEARQELTEEATDLWTNLVQQQSSLALLMHHKRTVLPEKEKLKAFWRGQFLTSLQ
ncbi:hypothetical protein Y032_0013g1976 [Ancylostoma ceylanicum]|uniref:Uncharacterized protein n=1 Tax=Ancylostoma ceylanicum TaxID=53326 RepID=A0A016VCZ3_9BILA|nr:hypothetical protein Y032_0013g1976 [Ancylostoma ceylanicum]